MSKIYFINEQGEKVSVDVSDEIAQKYKESLQEEWRRNAYEKYYSKSLDCLIDAGHDFEDKLSDTEAFYLEREENQNKQILLRKLKAALPYLTDLQRKTIHKLFVLNMSQAEIAQEEGVSRATIKERIDGIYAKLKRFIEKNKKFF